VLLDQRADPVDLFPTEAAAALETNRVEPELRFAVVAFDMNVWRLARIPGVKEEPEWSHPKYGRHLPMLRLPAIESNNSYRANRRRITASWQLGAAA
jgi:hypothetical protein